MDSIFCYRNPEQPSALSGSGPLQGMKMALQPTLSVAGWPTEAGSKALAGFSALEDAAVVERLRASGAVLVGATHVSEFGFGLNGNSGGEALRSHASDAELVLDMAGEARLAAARAGVCGFKPSYGLIPRLGLIGLIPSMESCAILASEIRSLRAICQAIAGPDERDFSLPDDPIPDFSVLRIDPGKMTLGVVPEALAALPPAESDAFRNEIEALRRMGFSVTERPFPDFPQHLTVHRIVGSVEASSCAGRYDSVRYGHRAPGAKNWNEMYLQSRGASFGPLLKGFLLQGAFFQFERYAAYEQACRLRARLLAGWRKLHAQAEFLVFPAAGPAPDPDSLDGLYAQAGVTAFANVSGQPALYLPSVSGRGGPGLQLAGPRLSDGRLLALGECLLKNCRGGE